MNDLPLPKRGGFRSPLNLVGRDTMAHRFQDCFWPHEIFKIGITGVGDDFLSARRQGNLGTRTRRLVFQIVRLLRPCRPRFVPPDCRPARTLRLSQSCEHLSFNNKELATSRHEPQWPPLTNFKIPNHCVSVREPFPQRVRPGLRAKGRTQDAPRCTISTPVESEIRHAEGRVSGRHPEQVAASTSR